MRLSQTLSSQVSDRSRARGVSYFLAGAVRSLTAENGVIEATVRGGDTYSVWLEPDSQQLRASCTCPFFQDHVEICKHIWAVVLAAEAQEEPLLHAGEPGGLLNLEPLLPESALDQIAPVGRGRPPAPTPFRPGARRQATPRPAPWRQLLQTINTSAALPAPIHPRVALGQLLYVIDLAATLATHALVLELMTRERKMSGDWGKPRPARVGTGDVSTLADPTDRQMLERLLGARHHFSWGAYAPLGQELSRLEVRGALAADLVPQLCATGRCMLRTGGGGRPSETVLSPVTWDEGPAWTFTLTVERAAPDAYRLRGGFARGEERLDVTEPVLVLADGFVFTATHAARASLEASFPWVVALRRVGQIVVPDEGRDQLIEALLTAPPTVLDAPAELRVERVAGHPSPRLRLRSLSDRPDRVRADLAFDYDGQTINFPTPEPVIRQPGSLRAISRDAEAERHALESLYQRGVVLEWSPYAGTQILQLPTTQMPRIVRQLLGEGWHVEADGQIYRRPGEIALDVRSGIDWFELRGYADFGDQRASLPALLAALHRGEHFVALDDGTVGLLPEEWLRRHGALAQLGSPEDGHLRFKRSQAGLLDALLAAQPQASWDEKFAQARDELKRFEGIHPVDPPATFRGTLRGYQREGLGWLLFLERMRFGGCLADDMGLGKTVMVLALLAARKEAREERDGGPALVVAPRSLVFNWRQEAARFTPDLRVLEYVGAGRAAMRGRFDDHDVVLTTYGTVRNDAAELSQTTFDYVILDEAQSIKNASSLSAKTTRVLNTRHRLALSGTPIENHLGELWSLFEFLNPGLLSSAAAFRRAGGAGRLDEDTLTLMARGLRPFILRRTKDQVASDLPVKTEQTIYCELEGPQRAMYDELRSHYRRTLLDGPSSNSGRTKFQVLEALLRLRQAACHPGLIDRSRRPEPSAKLDVLVPRLLEAIDEGHKTIVFSQFTSFLAILRDRLDAQQVPYEYLDGRTRDRQARVERFQNVPSCRLFLISLKAGGLGLNLTAAEYVFLLDPWWNPAVEAQAIDRAHRIGQTRRVFAYRLIARETVEERVLELQDRKRELADAILTADNSLIRNLGREDLELLLS